MAHPRSISIETAAKLACAFSGAAWGLFWFPLRWLGEAGIEGPWIGVLFFLVQALIALPVILFRLDRLLQGGRVLIITTFFAGSSLALYALAVVYTEVIRATLLYYLTPVWSTLLARWILGEPITLLRWTAIALAFAGMLVIFGIDVGLPWPRNFGDWLGLVSGMLWACAAVRLNTDKQNHALELSFGFFVWGTLVCIAIALLPIDGTASPPTLAEVGATLWWLVPVVAAVAVPGSFAAMWGARLIDPGIVGILFMTEVIVGTVTVAIWAGEPFGVREITGVLLISTAALLESVWDLFRRRRSGNAAV